MKMYKKVSVVIPTIGRLNYLDHSIQSLLNQAVPFSEIIVFDNSVEQNVRVLSSFENHPKIKWAKSGKQLDVIQSWNTAVSLCSNEYVTIFSDDDLALIDFHNEIQKGLVYSDLIFLPYQTMDEKSIVLGENRRQFRSLSSNEFRHKRMLGATISLVPGVVFKKIHFNYVGGFVCNFLPNALYLDDLLWFKISALAKNVYFSNTICWKYRIHQSQIGYLTNLRVFTENVVRYVDLVVTSLKKLGVDEDYIFPRGKSEIDYIDSLISSRFLIVLSKLKSAKKLDIQSGLKNYYEFLSSPATIKNKIITTCKLLKRITFYLFKRIKRV